MKNNPDKKPKDFEIGEKEKQCLTAKFKIMHSKIFQITKVQVVDEDCFLNENTLEQGDSSYYDYCSEIDDEEREEHIAYLVENVLPEGMFDLISENTMRYNGGAEQWKETFIADVRKKAEAITTDNVLEWVGPVYRLEQALKNPLDTGYMFYMDEEGWQSYAEFSYAFMRYVCELEVGTLLYIGGVIDYHF